MTTLLTSLLHFGLLLGLRTAIRELCMVDFIWQEVFNCNSQYNRYTTKDKLQIVNSLFRCFSFSALILYYVLQTAVCCLVYGVLPGANVRYVLLELVLVDLACVFAQFVTVRYSALKRSKELLFSDKLMGQNLKMAAYNFVTKGIHWDNVTLILSSRRFWFDIFLYNCFIATQYDVLSVAHCAFVHGVAMSLKGAKPFVAALVLLGFDKKIAEEKIFPRTNQLIYVVDIANLVLQGLLLFKLVLSQSFNLSLFLYVVLAPITFEFVNLDLKLHLD